jgi:hypothetical protein
LTDEELLDRWVALIEKAVNILRNVKIVLTSRKELGLSGDEFLYVERNVLALDDLLLKNWSEVSETAQYSSFRTYLEFNPPVNRSDSILARFEPNVFKTGSLDWNRLTFLLLRDYLDRCGEQDWTYKSGLALESLQSVLRCLTITSVSMNAIVPLFNVKIVGSAFQVNQAIELRTAKDLDLSKLNNEPVIVDTFPLKCSTFLQLSSESDFRFSSKPGPDVSVIQRVLVLFRLLGLTHASADRAFLVPKGDDVVKPYVVYFGQTAVQSGTSDVVTESIRTKIPQTWTRLSTLGEKGRFIQIALERYSNSFERTRIDDRLVDCISALEALYLKVAEKTELEYRLSLRVALVLGYSPSTRREIREIIEKSYPLRSQIVHGKPPRPVKAWGRTLDLVELTGYISGLLRSSLQVFMEVHHSSPEYADQDAFLDKVDDCILDSPAFEKTFGEMIRRSSK